MAVQVAVTPPCGEIELEEPCKSICEVFTELARLMTVYLEDHEAPTEAADYLELLVEALEAVAPITVGVWTIAYDGANLTVLRDGTEFATIPIPATGDPADVIDDPPRIVPSTGDSSDWKETPPGFSFMLPGCATEPEEDGGGTLESEDESTRIMARTSAAMGAINPKRAGVYMSIQAPMHECAYSLKNPYPTSVALIIRLGNSRSIIHSMRLHPISAQQGQQGLPGLRLPALLPPYGIDGTNYRFFSIQQWGLGTDCRLVIRFAGDPPVLGDLTWLDTDPLGPPPPLYGMPPRHPLITHIHELPPSRSVSDEWEIREGWCRQAKSQDQRAHQMMLNIDRNSLGRMSEDSPLSKTLMMMGSMLASRFIDRARHAVRHPDIAFEDAKPIKIDRVEADLRTVGTSMYKWMTCVPGKFGDERWSVDEVHDALGRFACGKTNVFHAHGAPNGVNMFSFAELAFAMETHAERLGLKKKHTAFWQAMPAICCAAAEMFVNCYHGGGDRAVCGYKAEHNPIIFKGADGLATPKVITKNTYTDAQRLVVFRKWQSRTSPEQRRMFGTLVHNALRDEPLVKFDPLVTLPDHHITLDETIFGGFSS